VGDQPPHAGVQGIQTAASRVCRLSRTAVWSASAGRPSRAARRTAGPWCDKIEHRPV